jgi:hypothetical protein
MVPMLRSDLVQRAPLELGAAHETVGDEHVEGAVDRRLVERAVQRR